jgi:type IV secretion system protein VirB9
VLSPRAARLAAFVLGALIARPGLSGEAPDARIRVLPYSQETIYRLKAYVGYQIDLEFAPGESFIGLGAGDLEGLSFAGQANHLFLKPRVAGVDTNLTVLTDRRSYHFEYLVSERRPDPASGDVVYALRFTYATSGAGVDGVERRLAEATQSRFHNLRYGYCGSPELKPEAAWDDGVQTRLRFGARRELPAVFVRNDDGSESLINFTVEAGEIVVHRIARRFVVRRGRLAGCIVNQAFAGGGERLDSGTVAPSVERVTTESRP